MSGCLVVYERKCDFANVHVQFVRSNGYSPSGFPHKNQSTLHLLQRLRQRQIKRPPNQTKFNRDQFKFLKLTAEYFRQRMVLCRVHSVANSRRRMCIGYFSNDSG